MSTTWWTASSRRPGEGYRNKPPPAVRRPTAYLAALLALAALPAAADGQDAPPPQQAAERPSTIELRHADQMGYNQSIDLEAKRFIGDVRLQQEDILMYCDSVYFYTGNYIKAFSRVRLDKADSIEVLSDYLFHNGNAKNAQFRGRVSLKDKNLTLTTDSLDYDFVGNKAFYFAGGKIDDGQATLTSQLGYYYSSDEIFYFVDKVEVTNDDYRLYTDTLKYDLRTKVVSFKGPTLIVNDTATLYSERGWYNTESGQSVVWRNARYNNPGHTLRADTIYYDSRSEHGEAFGNVRMWSQSDSLLLGSDYTRYNRVTGEALLTRRAVVTQVYDGDSLFLHADTLLTVLDTAGGAQAREVRAFHRAQMYGRDLQLRSDSVVFSLRDSVVRLYHAPVVWSDTVQMTADSMHMHLIDSDLREVHLLSDALIVIRHDSLHYDQVKGLDIVAQLRDRRLRRADVDRRAELIYYLEDQGRLEAMNYSKCRNIGIEFDQGRLSRLIFTESPEGKVHPVEEIPPAERFLRTFVDYDAVRPRSRADIFEWREVAGE